MAPVWHAGGFGFNKDMGGLLEQNGRDMLLYQAGMCNLVVTPVLVTPEHQLASALDHNC